MPETAERRRRKETLEAFADTILPGEKRHPADRAVAGAAPGPGAVAAGAVELLETPATGITEGLEALADKLDEHAGRHTVESPANPRGSAANFVDLSFGQRTALVSELLSTGHPEKELWVLLALFSNMAFDSAAHLHTAEAVRAGHPGLTAMGVFPPDEDGLWRFPRHTYGRKLASPHPDTTATGSPA
ncbi:hypothetical protein SAMN04487820_103246 [Actinopolyspora mzabensis]|uniref:Gluconate 2-dehydrogenase subunit 3 n=1 Tax=Actinopolyspora mzabensis TaxID=995066 RepID=A0A1G8Y6A8_ACTMZ|nr:DUF5987 family protein [Actinopolyspora mzabensis]SDJ97695.1 hypothetical protein SAMN04487820_103246 [Actinopolyspora mzabensis]